MKKYTLFSFVFILSLILLGFGVKSASASDSGCTSAGPYSTTTGQPCTTTTTTVTCPTGDVYSSVTGQRCTAWWQDISISSDVAQFNALFKSNFKIGLRGNNDVTALQQFLKDQGYYFGKIDGSYGRITSRAVSDFKGDNNIGTTVTPTLLPQPVIPQPPVSTSATCTVNSFTATPSTITAGQSSTLSWNTSNCNSVIITGSEIAGNSYNSSINTKVVSPTATVTYHLSAFDSNGYMVGTTHDVTVTVTSTTTPSTSITITSPNGGNYKVGDSLLINWTSSDYGFTEGNKGVDINLLTYDPNSPARNMVTTITSHLVNSAGYGWTIPSNITSGQYIVRVASSETGEQVSTLSQPFTITGSGVTVSNAPIINSISPASGPADATVVSISGAGFTTSNNSVYLSAALPSYFDSFPSSTDFGLLITKVGSPDTYHTAQFTIPSSIPMNGGNSLINPGTYTITVVNANGVSNHTTFTVTVGSSH